MAETKAQPPINKKMIKPVTDAIDAMEKHQVALAKQPFTCSDLLQLFIPPDLHEMLTRTFSLCEPSGHTQDLFWAFMTAPETGGGHVVNLRFHWSGFRQKDGFYVPYHQGAVEEHTAVVQDSAPQALRERLTQTAHDLAGIHYRFAQVRRVLTGLNKPTVCRTLAAMRYHWPCIVPILRAARLEREAEKLIDANSRSGDGANISHELRRKLAATNQTIAGHILLEDVPMPPALPVEYDLRHHFNR